MKFIVMFSAVIIGVLFGFIPHFTKPRPIIWRWVAILFVAIASVLVFLTPTAGSFSQLKIMNNITDGYTIDVKFNVLDGSPEFNSAGNYWVLSTRNPEAGSSGNAVPQIIIINQKDLPDEFTTDKMIVANLNYDKDSNRFIYNHTKSIAPLMTYPYLPALQDKIRIMVFHVPMAWVSVVAYMVSMIYSILYLRRRDLKYDLYASSSAALGFVFTILATVTGMIWAKFNWGSFWNWDPRQTSILVLMLIYAAYFALRSALDREDLKARLSSVYSIIAFLTVPFFVFILPRMFSGLHPGAKGEDTAGPVVSNQPGMLDSSLLYAFGLALAGFIIIYFWMMSLAIRYDNIKTKYSAASRRLSV